LKAGCVECTRDRALRAAQAVVRSLEKSHPDRIIVAPPDRPLSLSELAARGKLRPKKGKRSRTK
jgi:hypothetical protein